MARQNSKNKKMISVYLSKKLFTSLTVIAYFRGIDPNSQFIESELGALVDRVFAKGDYEDRLNALATKLNCTRDEVVERIMHYQGVTEFYDEGILNAKPD
jgi:hypothetical protein